MINVSILLTQNHRMLSVAAILDVLETVNRLNINEGRSKLFDVLFISDGEDGASVYSYPVKNTGVDTKSNLVLIPAFTDGQLSGFLKQNSNFIPWLKNQYANGAKIASFCTGAFLLGMSGLLDNKPATTHVNATDAFSANFPTVRLQPHSIVTKDGNIYTSGGATSSFHLLLQLIQEYCGRETVVQLAKIYAIDLDRSNQIHFSAFKPVLCQDDELVREVQELILMHYGDGKTLDEMLGDVPSSRRNLVRRFKQATGITPIEFLQKARIEAARKLLEFQGGKTIFEIMLLSGYNDMKGFRLLFKKYTGLTPKMYREKFAMGLKNDYAEMVG